MLYAREVVLATVLKIDVCKQMVNQISYLVEPASKLLVCIPRGLDHNGTPVVGLLTRCMMDM